MMIFALKQLPFRAVCKIISRTKSEEIDL